jgi:hypothetical protein
VIAFGNFVKFHYIISTLDEEVVYEKSVIPIATKSVFDSVILRPSMIYIELSLTL